jgi:hypothetical protein
VRTGGALARQSKRAGSNAGAASGEPTSSGAAASTSDASSTAASPSDASGGVSGAAQPEAIASSSINEGCGTGRMATDVTPAELSGDNAACAGSADTSHAPRWGLPQARAWRAQWGERQSPAQAYWLSLLPRAQSAQ